MRIRAGMNLYRMYLLLHFIAIFCIFSCSIPNADRMIKRIEKLFFHLLDFIANISIKVVFK